MITRQRVILRAQYGWERQTVPFNPGVLRGNYRTHAPGYVAMCWGIPASPPVGGPNIINLINYCYEIPWQELKPGDAIGHIGPDSSVDSDGGVAVIFEHWNDNPETRVAVTWAHLPMFPNKLGPGRRLQPVDFRWHCYRYNNIADE